MLFLNLKEFYENIGQNYEIVLKRMMGNEEFLYMLLGKFVSDTSIEALEKAMNSHEAAEIFEQAHTLKGVAENLGMKPLYEKVSVLVEITRKGSVDGIDEVFAEVKQIYVEIINLLEIVTLEK